MSTPFYPRPSHTRIIIHLEHWSIAPQMMFDANAFVAAEIAVHFALKRATLVQKTQNVVTTQGGHRAANQGPIDGLQAGRRIETNIGRPFRLEGRPIHLRSVQPPSIAGTQPRQNPVQRANPTLALHPVHQLLGGVEVLDPREAVVVAAVGDPPAMQTAGKPFTRVDPDLHAAGQPGLQAGTHQAKLAVEPVFVEVQALGPFPPAESSRLLSRLPRIR